MTVELVVREHMRQRRSDTHPRIFGVVFSQRQRVGSLKGDPGSFFTENIGIFLDLRDRVVAVAFPYLQRG